MSQAPEYKPYQYEDELKGILLMLAASLCFSTMGFFVKKLSSNHTAMDIILYRSIVSLIIMLVSLKIYKPEQPGGKPFMLAMRGVYGFAALFFYFYSVCVLPLSTAATFGKTSPLFTALIAGFVLKEKAGGAVWTAIIIGFTGILFILQPNGNTSITGSLAGIGSGFFAALAYATVRGLAGYYDARVLVVSFSVAGLICSTAYISVMSYLGVPEYAHFAFLPHGIDIFYAVMVGIIAALAQYMMSRAFYFGRASIVGSVSYVEIVFSTFAGFIAGDALPDLLSFFGIMLVVISGVLIVRARKRV